MLAIAYLLHSLILPQILPIPLRGQEGPGDSRSARSTKLVMIPTDVVMYRYNVTEVPNTSP